MRVLILHLAEPKITDLAQSLQGALEKEQCRVDLVDTNHGGGLPISTAPYGLVIIMTTFRGLWRPIIPIAIDSLIKRCTRLEGRKSAALVLNRFNSGKAVKFLMHLMEVQGMVVADFGVIRSERDLPNLASRLARIGTN